MADDVVTRVGLGARKVVNVLLGVRRGDIELSYVAGADVCVGERVTAPMSDGRQVSGWVTDIVDADALDWDRIGPLLEIERHAPGLAVCEPYGVRAARACAKYYATGMSRLLTPVTPKHFPSADDDNNTAHTDRHEAPFRLNDDLFACSGYRSVALRCAPADAPAAVVASLSAACDGTLLVVTPHARSLGDALAAHNIDVVVLDKLTSKRAGSNWLRATTGKTPVVVTDKALMRVGRLGAVCVLDCTDAAHKAFGEPGIDQRVVARHVAEAADVPCVFASAMFPIGPEMPDVADTVELDGQRSRWCQVSIVNPRDEAPDAAPFGDRIARRIRAELRANGRVLVVCDREGLAATTYCGRCGELGCDVCGGRIAVAGAHLVCRKCGPRATFAHGCFRCGSRVEGRVRGVDDVAQRLGHMFPSFRVQTTTHANACERAWRPPPATITAATGPAAYGPAVYDVAVAVGVDAGLARPGARAAERYLAMLAGLAGRVRREGELFVVSGREQPLLTDFTNLAHTENIFRREREEQQMPPFRRLFSLVFDSGRLDDAAKMTLADLAETWQQRSGVDVLGPAAMPHGTELLCAVDDDVAAEFSAELKQTVSTIFARKAYRGAVMIVDPVDDRSVSPV